MKTSYKYNIKTILVKKVSEVPALTPDKLLSLHLPDPDRATSTMASIIP